MPGWMSGDAAHHTGRILVVEDDAVQARALGVVLCHEGYAVETATTGAEALERTHGVPGPDLVFLDLQLPALSGTEVARRIRAASGVPIILLTARRQESDKVVGLDAGADDYVSKPFSPNELLARVCAQLRRGRLPGWNERRLPRTGRGVPRWRASDRAAHPARHPRGDR